MLLRVSEPAPGIASIGTCSVGENAMANVGLYLYGADVAQVAAAEQARWKAWLSELLGGR